MPTPRLRVGVSPADEVRANEAAAALSDVIGDRPQAWDVSISTPSNASYWLVEVSGDWRGEQIAWRLPFDGPEQTAAAVARVFRLNLRPYASS